MSLAKNLMGNCSPLESFVGNGGAWCASGETRELKKRITNEAWLLEEAATEGRARSC